MIRALILLSFAAFVAAAGANARAPFADSPPSGHTGGFGEPTCAECHAFGTDNASAASVEIDGLPDAYEPGETYALTIRVRHPAMRRAGFQLAARVAEGPTMGTQAGAFSVTMAGIRITQAKDGVAYAQHDGAPFVEAGDSSVWHVMWTAPAEACASVAFHAAANAADGDASPFGDDILLFERVVPVRN